MELFVFYNFRQVGFTARSASDIYHWFSGDSAFQRIGRKIIAADIIIEVFGERLKLLFHGTHLKKIFCQNIFDCMIFHRLHGRIVNQYFAVGFFHQGIQLGKGWRIDNLETFFGQRIGKINHLHGKTYDIQIRL